ncbi:hypothetical protein ABB29_10330 [Pseudoxanthomonas dokdonensis]|uniref:Hydrogenase n=2 Tax=Pseudoxanthomonas dokdonensis TaxID=344882 RepID=A0A0R0CH35_9GAMM|nr:hypothetical protein ABB29_10330 [Pseudoxanthomonas dokdonensis]
MVQAPSMTEHRGDDDLLSAGLGLDGLRAMTAPAFADPEHPTASELRRRAIWSNWRGIADLSATGGYGQVYGSVARIPGREFSSLLSLPGAAQPHRVLMQLPDAFDTGKRCVVVAASSGSRGVYGAIAVAAPWALPKGCAVVYTDKGAGSDYFDLDARVGSREDGTVAGADEAALAFAPQAATAASGVAVKHAHSQDNPEADWGRHVKQAAEFALSVLDQQYPHAAPFRFDNTRIIATGISNGGGAVLRAAELDGDWLDAVVAGEPNIQIDGHGSRDLYDYVTEAALLMPCALLHLPAERLPQPPLRAQAEPAWSARCASLKAAGQIGGDNIAAQAASAYQQLRDAGWSDEALVAGALNVGFDVWRAIAVTYASSYGRYGVGEHPCGFGFSAQNPDFSARPATAAERGNWWAEGSGIPPGAGVGIIDPQLGGADPTLAGLQCLRGLSTGDGADAARVRAGIAEVKAGLPRAGLPVVVVHGTDDGLIPPAFSSAPYVVMAQASGRPVSYWQVRHAQHFDGFLALPDYGSRYVPLLPYMYAALDQIDAQLDGRGRVAGDSVIASQPRGQGTLQAAQLKLPQLQ